MTAAHRVMSTNRLAVVAVVAVVAALLVGCSAGAPARHAAAPNRLTPVPAAPVTPPADPVLTPPEPDPLSFLTGGHASQLPFELVNNHIYIHAQVDGQPVRMIVDTADVSVLTPAAVVRLGLSRELRRTDDPEVATGPARGRELVVGGVRLAAPVFQVFAFETFSDVEGSPFDGVVGLELFQRLAVRIDYPASQLTLTRSEDFVPPAGAIVVPVELRDHAPVAAGSIDGIPARFLIDTGARTSVTVNSPFARAHQLEARYHPAFEAIIAWGANGASRAKPVRIGKVTLGDAVVTDVVGELYTGDRGEFASPDRSATLGGGVLKRFAVTFDDRDRKMYLEPGPALPRDIYDRAGMFFLRTGDKLRIVAVTPRGPAARAGLAAGDRIVAIDRAPAASRTVAAWRTVLSGGEVGARHVLTVTNDRGRRDRAIVLAELLP
ncbi:MAG: aspartyl protease family protein [Kofleriaceae bacterium]